MPKTKAIIVHIRLDFLSVFFPMAVKIVDDLDIESLKIMKLTALEN